ncbi:MAG: PEP/pyruvate-binding domain-containing protein, partial [Thermoanaerobaculia bacterium]|nr:PEP/pyruvate-binding domain-containing protein [Thermoanaerobaculia bacterium]
MTEEKHVYAFGGGSAEGTRDQKEVLGGKGAGLAEMSRLGIPVPPGFTLTTPACIHFLEHAGEYPPGFRQEVEEHLSGLEEQMGRKLGDPEDPLLLSVRSGAVVSMPGMMDTVLNLGLTREMVERAETANPRFLRDCYRRLLSMYGDVVLGIRHEAFESVLKETRGEEGVDHDHELSVEALDRVIDRYEELIRETQGDPFPQDPEEQLWGAVDAVFESWNNRRAR